MIIPAERGTFHMALTLISTKEGTSYNQKTKTEYVYETSVYFDDEQQKRIQKRRVIGKIDPATGQRVPTGSVGRPRMERVYRTASVPANETDHTGEEPRNLPPEKEMGPDRDVLGEILNSLEVISAELAHMQSILTQSADRLS